MAMITQFSQLGLDKKYSYADYLKWQFKKRVELIKAKVMLISPAPNVNHQQLSRDLLRPISNYFDRISACLSV
jgi:hypothetical protein